MESGLFKKLTVLSEGAKFDVSCSSSGAARTNTGRIGNAACAGICHSWAADGRCISLLKVLLSNDCAYDCKYCVNRRSADTLRATFEPKELADLAMEFYRRNYIEGLFISSAVLISPDHTMEMMYKALYILREVYGFAGYIHAKVIPGASREILHRVGLVADRLSVNIETPSESSLRKLAPQKKPEGIFSSMAQITLTQAEQKTLKPAGFMGANISYGDGSLSELLEVERRRGPQNSDIEIPLSARPIALQDSRKRYKEKFAPAGQTTQMVVGASDDSDWQIVHTSEALYRKFSLKRVYFSAYVPIVQDPEMPAPFSLPPLKREHRLYQADFLLRFYGFHAEEILDPDQPNLDPDLDPKVVWALRHIQDFPMEVNKASMEELMRIPGIGYVSAKRIVRQRRMTSVRFDDLKKMGVVVKRAKYFLTCSGRYHGGVSFASGIIREALLEREKYHQMSIFEALGPT